MNANFGLFPDSDLRDGRGRPIKGKARREGYAVRARTDFATWQAGSAGDRSAAQ